MPQIAVLIPTRGLHYTESLDSVMRSLAEVDFHWPFLLTWKEAIPFCFETLAERFMNETDSSHAWFVEEDMVIPQGGLDAMLALDSDIAVINYPSKTSGCPCGQDTLFPGSGILAAWTGCMLIKRAVFQQLVRPWFRADQAIALVHSGSACKEKYLEFTKRPYDYGGQDLYFIAKAQMAGFKLGVVPEMLCGHLDLEALGKKNVNNGCHVINRVQVVTV